MALEKQLRAFTRKAIGLNKQNYWERLKSFKMYSNQQRNERYKVIYIWKSLQGLVPSLPVDLKDFCGTAATFKIKLDKFLTHYPDNPQTEDLTPGATNWEGGPSNCLIDWIRKLGLPPVEV